MNKDAERADYLEYNKKHGASPILYTEEEKLSDFFIECYPWAHDLEQPKEITRPSAYEGNDHFTFSCWINEQTDGDYVSWLVTPKAFLLDRLSQMMLGVEGDSIYFSLVEHLNGCSLLIAKYNQIIGSRYIAYLSEQGREF